MNSFQIAQLQAENEALRALVFDRGKELLDALTALSDMWNQYCPPPWTHQSMSAGEGAEEVLRKWNLVRPDKSAITIAYLTADEEEPEIVVALREIPHIKEP